MRVAWFCRLPKDFAPLSKDVRNHGRLQPVNGASRLWAGRCGACTGRRRQKVADCRDATLADPPTRARARPQDLDVSDNVRKVDSSNIFKFIGTTRATLMGSGFAMLPFSQNHSQEISACANWSPSTVLDVRLHMAPHWLPTQSCHDRKAPRNLANAG